MKVHPASGAHLKCKADGCTDRIWVVKHQLCQAHYQRYNESRRLELLQRTSNCLWCKTPMHTVGFATVIQKYCSSKCCKAAQRRRIAETETPELRRARIAYKYAWKLKRYGLTPEMFSAILAKQLGCCALCGTPEENCKGGLVVDHDHRTGKARGLLCRVCNAGIGALGDSIENLQRAIDYLYEHAIKDVVQPVGLEEPKTLWT